MKKLFLSICAFMGILSLNGATTFYDANKFPLLGKGVGETANRYTRLPDSLATTTRPGVWNLAQNSAGMAIRFSSNSDHISAIWKSTQGNDMSHMTATGIRGLDLYALKDDGTWDYVACGRPKKKQALDTICFVSDMPKIDREYMLYLSLYDGVDSLYIGVNSEAKIEAPKVNLPKREKPIVFYGSSILQGGCASRPGMAHTNIIGRRLNHETINLGFSGNGQLDLDVAEVIATMDAGMFVLDFVPNATVVQMDERMKKFYHIIREKNPITPILFIEDPIFTTTNYNAKMKTGVEEKNAKVWQLFQELKKEGEKNIYFLKSTDMIGHDNEATVDGIHFTDLGFMRYSDLLTPLIKKHLKK